MKIIVISTPIFKLPVVGYSGLEHLAFLQAEGLAKLGHEVSLVAPDGSICPGVNIISMGPEKGINEKNSYKRYWPELLKADVIIDNSWQKWSYLLKAEGRLKAPVLGVLHAPVMTMYQTLPPVEKPCFVCISQDHANSFEAIHNREARFVYNGVDPEFYKPLDIPRTDRFLFLARFSSIKGPDIAIQACKEADVGLDLIGDTSITNEPAYLEQCKKMADGKQIRIVGSATRGETVYWYSQAHCMIHPVKNFREPFGLAPVESMMCQTPVIAWNNGAMRETICPGETGLLCNTYEELVTHIRTMSKVLKPEERLRCREWALQFSVDKMIERYEGLCIKAIERGGW